MNTVWKSVAAHVTVTLPPVPYGGATTLVSVTTVPVPVVWNMSRVPRPDEMGTRSPLAGELMTPGATPAVADAYASSMLVAVTRDMVVGIRLSQGQGRAYR